MFDLNISGESIDDFWLVNRYWESGLIKFKSNKTYVSTSIQFFSNIKYFKGNYYAGGLGSLKKLIFSANFKLEGIETVLNVDRTDLNYNSGVILDMVVGKDNELYLLCSYNNEESMPSYTTVVKWDGTTSTLLFTSEWGVQGLKIFSGNNGIYFDGWKIEYEGTFVKRSLSAVGNILDSNSKLFIVSEQESDYLTLGIVGGNVYLNQNANLFTLEDGESNNTGIKFPSNTFGFTGYNEQNIIVTGLTEYYLFNGEIWQQLKSLQNFDETYRLGDPVLLEDGIACIVTQRALSTTFYLVRGYPQ